MDCFPNLVFGQHRFTSGYTRNTGVEGGQSLAGNTSGAENLRKLCVPCLRGSAVVRSLPPVCASIDPGETLLWLLRVLSAAAGGAQFLPNEQASLRVRAAAHYRGRSRRHFCRDALRSEERR